jgi:hypothetical protein
MGPINDNKGRRIGKIEQSTSTTKLYDSKGLFRGSYDRKTDRTLDRRGHYVGKGDQLMRLLKSHEEY